MQNKKENQKHWKDKLEEDGSFPYAPAQKELAWQELNNRLQERKGRKKAVWYWAAAACLLPLLLFGLFFNTHQPASLANIVSYTSTAAKPLADTQTGQNEIVVTASTHVPGVKRTGIQRVKQQVIIVKFDDKKDTTPIDTMNNIAIVVAPNDSINTVASVVQPQKKKLKVVHINELNEPYESVPVIAHNAYYPKFLPLQIARESIYPEPLKRIYNTGFISLKNNKSSN